MARKPGAGICVHCLKYDHQRNWDHVFPVSWYPDTTPPNLEKWKIPSCKPCNDNYGRIEKKFGQILSLCIEPDKPESKGVYNRLRRGFDPRLGKNDKDKKARAQERNQIINDFMYGNQIPKDGIYPGLGERWNRKEEDQIALTLPKKFVDLLAVKIVRGIAYIEDGMLINENYVIEPYAVTEEGAAVFNDALARYGHSLSKGLGIKVERAIAPEDGISSIYKITIWAEFIIYASVSQIVTVRGI